MADPTADRGGSHPPPPPPPPPPPVLPSRHPHHGNRETDEQEERVVAAGSDPTRPEDDAAHAERQQRRRRSALRHPALVDPADLADDATGRVEIFTLDVAQVDGHARGAALRDDHGQPAAARPSAVVSLAEGIEGRVALAALLVTCLVLGLLLTR